MDYGQGRGVEKSVPVLQGDEFFSNKLLSRNPSVGCSSRRIFYYRSTEGVPFKWEMQPGTPKDPPKEDIIPPLSPPPAVLSLGLPKPCINIEEPKASIRTRIMFWKHSKKNQGIKKAQAGSEGCNENGSASDNFANFDICSSDGEFLGSPRDSSSSFSSSLSSSNGHFMESSRIQNPVRDTLDRPYTCSPWNFTSKLVRVARRV